MVEIWNVCVQMNLIKTVFRRKPCPCGERMEPFEGIKLTEIKIIPKYFQRLFEITEEFGKVRRNNVAARLKLVIKFGQLFWIFTNIQPSD